MDRRCGSLTHSLFAESKKEANQAKNSHVSLLKSLNQGEKQVWAISLHPKVVQTRLVFVDAGLSPAKWLGLSHRQAKNPRIMLTTEGRVLEEILKTKFNLRSSTEEEDELKIAPRP